MYPRPLAFLVYKMTLNNKFSLYWYFLNRLQHLDASLPTKTALFLQILQINIYIELSNI